MARYIDADKLKDRIKASCVFPNIGQDGYFLQDCTVDLIDKQPTADVEETKWIDVDERLPDKSGKYIVCNRSGAVYQTKFYTYPENKGGHWGQKDKGKNIIAWMPMPEVCLPFSLPRERKEK